MRAIAADSLMMRMNLPTPPPSSARPRPLLRSALLPLFLVSLLLISATHNIHVAAAACISSDHGHESEDVDESSPMGNDDGDERRNDQSTDADTTLLSSIDAMAEEENDIEKNNFAEEEAQHAHKHNPMGLQTWSDESSFLRALESGHLLLVILLAPWCERGDNAGVQQRASLAADLLDGIFSALLSSPDSTFTTLRPLARPLIGIMDASAVGDEWINKFGPVTHYPALKFILSISTGNQNEYYGDEDDTVQLWDFLGPRETAKDIIDSVLMYWYRFVVSDALRDGEATAPPIFTFSSPLQLTNFLESHGERVLRPAQPQCRDQSKLESELFNFYMGQIDAGGGGEVGGIFHLFDFLEEGDTNSSSECNPLDKDNDEERSSTEHCNSSKKFVQEIDPYILLIQRRSEIDYDYGNIELEGENENDIKDDARVQMQRRAHEEFNELAKEMSHRRDVAFFSLNITAHNSRKIGLFDIGATGTTSFFRARRYVTYSLHEPTEHHPHEENDDNMWNHHRRRVIHNVKTDWGGVNQLPPHAVFVPTEMEITEQQKSIHGKGAVKDPTTPIEYVQSSLVPLTIVHATPTIIWFDRDRMAQLAFPWYRKIHTVLFVDMALVHTSRIWPLSINHTSEVDSIFNQHKAIQMFYHAALRHRLERPKDDVVFLIIPSSNVRIMTSFGVDIWTPLDEALFGMADEDQSNADEGSSGINGNSYCSNSGNGESSNILPLMMITDSSGRSGTQSSRYYLCDIFSSSRVTFNNGGAMTEFIDSFFSGTIGKPFIRSESPLPTSQFNSAQNTNQQNINKPNVTVLTGNTFESLVMDRNLEHTMLLMQSTTCGHCKRFSIFWNELSTLIQAMNWSSVIKVMKIDVAKNDVPHNKVNAWDVPAVYYFPANEKSDPIEMTPITMQNSNPQNDYDEGLSWITSGYDLIRWMVKQGKLDLELLLRLDLSFKALENEADEKQ